MKVNKLLIGVFASLAIFLASCGGDQNSKRRTRTHRGRRARPRYGTGG